MDSNLHRFKYLELGTRVQHIDEKTLQPAPRSSYFPNLDKIRDWVGTRGIDSRLTFIIAKRIGERGLAPGKYILETGKLYEPKYLIAMKAAVKKTIEETRKT